LASFTRRNDASARSQRRSDAVNGRSPSLPPAERTSQAGRVPA
jgi:hypothetical protein